MANYDIGDALHRIELLLLASMRRNLKRHLHEEQDEGFRWSMWQAEQLTALGSWTRRNYRQYAPQFTKINQAAIGLLQQSAERAALVEEDLILRTGVQRAAGFFNAPEDKLSALTNAVRHDLSQAEHSILRQADDLYRQTLFDAHMYLQTGSGTLNNAIDTAVQDLVQRGIRSVTYRNGHRVEASVYARMALRSANVRAKLTGEGAARDKFGVHTVLVSPSGIACEQCAPWLGKVLVDDVYCSGTAQEAAEMKLPLLSDAIRQGFLHPQCNCAVHTYLPGVSKPPPPVTEQDRQNAVKRYKLTQQQRYNERQIRRWKYAEDAAPDEAAKKAAHAKVKAWQQQNQALCDAHPDELRRDYQREKIWNAPKQPVVPDVIEKERDNPLTTVPERGTIEDKERARDFDPLQTEKVVPILREYSKGWIAELSSEEKRAISKYTKNDGDADNDKFFARLNAMLRGDIPENDTLNYYSGVISDGISKFRLEYDIICYRGIDVNIVEGMSVGDIYTSEQFFSSSVTKKGALNKKFFYTIIAPKGSTGAYIQLLSAYPNQREFLFNKGSKFRILSILGNSTILEAIV